MKIHVSQLLLGGSAGYIAWSIDAKPIMATMSEVYLNEMRLLYEGVWAYLSNLLSA